MLAQIKVGSCGREQGHCLVHKRQEKKLKILGWLEVLQKEGWDVGGSYKSYALHQISGEDKVYCKMWGGA